VAEDNSRIVRMVPIVCYACHLPMRFRSSRYHGLFVFLLICAGLLINRAVQAKPDLPDLGAKATPVSASVMTRLEPPPLPANPTQAEKGASVYWLHCQPCHGDRGQGLTDEWRAHYPPEEQNCWQSGCHGQNPSPNAFVLPANAPSVLGDNSLQRFATAADLHTFIRQTMPYQAPNSLPPEEYWAITAFLLVEHGLPPTELPLEEANLARQIGLHPRSAMARATVPSLYGSVAALAIGGIISCSLLFLFCCCPVWRRCFS
jgi:mono/diheme cytochrome c family protein